MTRERSWTARAWLLGLLLSALFATWPLALHPGTHIPTGREEFGTVALFNLWTLEWNRDRILQGGVGYWDAPIFHPVMGTFALSEPQPLLGLMFAPLEPLLGAPAAYNLVLVGILLLNGIAARRMLGQMQVDPFVARLLACLAVVLPGPLCELGILQLTAIFPLLLTLGELYALWSRPTPGSALRLAVWLGMTLWTCLYYTLFGSVLWLLGALMLVRRAQVAPDMRRAIAGAALVLALFGAPFLLGQGPMVSDHAWNAKPILTGSASLSAYLQLDPRSAGATIEPWLAGSLGSPSLYPGTCLLVFALFGFVRERRGPRRRFVLFCVSGILTAMLISLGSRTEIFGTHPYSLTLQQYWPGFAQLRSPYRAAVFVQIFLLALCGLGLSAFLREQARRRGAPIAAALVGVCVFLGMLEVLPLGQRLHPYPATALHEPWVRWLRDQPEGPVLRIPSPVVGRIKAYEPITVAMLQGLVHGHPLVNGYSGFFPPESDRLMMRLKTFPRGDARKAVADSGARYVVVPRRFVARHAREFDDLDWLTPIFKDDGHVVYAPSPDR